MTTEDPKLTAHYRAMGLAACEFPAWTMRAIRENSVPLDVEADAVALWRLVQLRAAVDRDIESQVSALRRSRVSWADVGVALGVTPQAAQQRYRGVAPVVRRRAGAGA